MTPQLQQAIKLLQFSHTELMEYVEGELESNPLLEAQTPSDDAGSDHDDDFKEAPEAREDEGSLEGAYEADANSGESLGQMGKGGSFNDNAFEDDRGTSEINLRDHLQQQLTIDIRGATERMIGAAPDRAG